MINRDNVEIRTQLHQMDAEGLQDEEPNVDEIISFMTNEGYIIHDIDIGFDSVMQLWYWTCTIV